MGTILLCLAMPCADTVGHMPKPGHAHEEYADHFIPLAMFVISHASFQLFCVVL